MDYNLLCYTTYDLETITEFLIVIGRGGQRVYFSTVMKWVWEVEMRGADRERCRKELVRGVH